MEEKKNNKKALRLLCLIPIVIGLVLAIFGIIRITGGKGISLPGMMEDGWFEASVDKNATIMSGVGMLIGGLFLAVGGGLMVFGVVAAATSTHKAITSTNGSNLSNIGSRLSEVFTQVTGVELNQKKEDVYCEYCGSKINPKENKCSSCGAKITQKKEN